MRNNLARKHRRIAAAEHAVEERMKQVASDHADDLGDAHGLEATADEISAQADRHKDVADRIEDDA